MRLVYVEQTNWSRRRVECGVGVERVRIVRIVRRERRERRGGMFSSFNGRMRSTSMWTVL